MTWAAHGVGLIRHFPLYQYSNEMRAVRYMALCGCARSIHFDFSLSLFVSIFRSILLIYAFIETIPKIVLIQITFEKSMEQSLILNGNSVVE